MNLTKISIFLSFLSGIIEKCKAIIDRINNFIKNKKIKKEYDEVDKIVDEGNVDDINNRLK